MAIIRWIVTFTVAAIAFFAGQHYFLTTAATPPPVSNIEGVLPHAKNITDFQLTTQHKQAFTKQNLAQKWSWIFFGYTHCSDICLMTLALFTQMKKSHQQQFPKQAEKTQYIFISVDSEHDTPERLAAYMENFDASFIALSGTEKQLSAIRQQFGVATFVNPSEHNPQQIDHSATLYLTNPQGNIAGIFTAPHEGKKLVRIYQQLQG